MAKKKKKASVAESAVPKEIRLSLPASDTVKLPKTLKVTAADIRKGKKENEEWCPIACALRRVIPKGWTPRVGDAECIIEPDEDSVYIPIYVNGEHRTDIDYEIDPINIYLGEKANDFIGAFDEKGAKGVKPTTFTLSIQ